MNQDNQFPVTFLRIATPVGEVVVKCGVDTFAGVTILDERMASKLGLAVVDTHTELQTVSGEPLKVSGQTSFDVWRGGKNDKYGRYVRLDSVVIPRLKIPGIDILLGKNAHLLLGESIQIDVRNKGARYVGAVNDMSKNKLETKDFTVWKDQKQNWWNVVWKWKERPHGLKKGPTVYKKQWVDSKIKETAFNELRQWLELGIITYIGEVSDHPDRGWLPLNLIRQPHKLTTPVRVAIDLTELNKFIEYSDEFSKYEVSNDKLREWRRMNEGYLIDLSKAFLRVRIHDEDQRKFLTVRVNNSLYEVNALPFGLSIAPRVLFEIMNYILRDTKGVSFFRDDIYVQRADELEKVIRILKDNGFVVKPVEDVTLQMQKKVKLLGLTVSVKNESGQKVLHWIREEKVQGEHRVPEGTELECMTARSALGYLASLLPGNIPVARWLRPLVALLRSKCTKIASSESWESVVGTDKEVAQGFKWLKERWAKEKNPMKGVWAIPKEEETIRLYTDASDQFIGYVMLNEKNQVIVDDCQLIKDKAQINLSELDAVIIGLQQCLDYGYKQIDLRTDSSSVVGWLKAISNDKKIKLKGIHSKLVERRINILRKMVKEFEMKLSVMYVKSRLNVADELTRVGNNPTVIGAMLYSTSSEKDRAVAYGKTLRKVQEGMTDVKSVIESLHQELIHPSPSTLLTALKRLGFNNSSKLVMDSVKNCDKCCEKRARLIPWTSTGKSFEFGKGEIFMDALKVFTYDSEYDGCITIIHADSRMAKLYQFSGPVNAKIAKDALADWTTTFGHAQVLRTDNGSEFSNEVMKRYCEKVEIRHYFSSVSHPQSNGIVERFHRTLLNYIRAQYGNGENWYARALEGLRVYNRTPHSALYGKTPLEAYFDLQTEVSYEEGEMIIEDEDDNDVEEGEHDVILEQPFKEGQTILWWDSNNKLKDRYSWKKGIVVEYKGRGAYRVAFGNKERVVNREKMVEFREDLREESDEITNVDQNVEPNSVLQEQASEQSDDQGEVVTVEESSASQDQTNEESGDQEQENQNLRRSTRNCRKPDRLIAN